LRVSSGSAFRIRTPASAPRPGPDHDRYRGGESECAGAGDNQNRHGVEEGVREAGLRPEL
jgi:hypothetical protein